MMSELHTKTELQAMKKAELVTALLDLERKYAESEREVWEFRYQDSFPAQPYPQSDPRRRAERFMLATAKGLVFSYRGVDTTIPAVSRAIVNDLREGVRQYDQALAEHALLDAAAMAREGAQ